MTGRTHDLAAFTALGAVVVTYDMPQMTLATVLVAFSVNMIGGLAPDLDQSTAALWRKMRGGSLIGKVISPLIGGHRFLSHSIIGVILAGFIAHILLGIVGKVLLVDMEVVWWAFMIGFVSHLLMDLFTHDGVPLLFPIPIRFGFPPLSFLRIKTGGLVEKSFIFPILIFINGVIYYYHYPYILQFLRNLQ